MKASTWTVAAAKAKLSEVIDLARSHGPQTITRKGRAVAVVVAAEGMGAQDPTQRKPCEVLRRFPAAQVRIGDNASRGSPSQT